MDGLDVIRDGIIKKLPFLDGELTQLCHDVIGEPAVVVCEAVGEHVVHIGVQRVADCHECLEAGFAVAAFDLADVVCGYVDPLSQVGLGKMVQSA